LRTRKIAIGYFDAWRARDAERFRALLADDASWDGPTWRAANADECMAAFPRASTPAIRVGIQHVWVDGDNALTWFDVRRDDAPPMPIANWTHVKHGRIVHIRADILPPTWIRDLK
jgi:ketosteroid isomerase-like protein